MKKPKPYVPPYRYVEAIWDDAASNAESWVLPKDVTPPEQVITRGWLVRDEPTFITIASSVPNEDLTDDTNTVGCTMTIPRGMVVSMRDITVTTKRDRKSNRGKIAAAPTVPRTTSA